MKNTLKFLFQLVVISMLLKSCGAKRKVSTSVSAVDKMNTISKHHSSMMNRYSEILGVNVKDMNAKLYQYIDEWMGAPHRLGGLNKDGIDCSAFVGNIFTNVYNKQLPRSSRDMAEVIKRKFDNDLKEGDLLFFSFGGRKIDHVGVYLSNNKFVHVSTKQGVVISNLKDPWYYKYFVRCGSAEI